LGPAASVCVAQLLAKTLRVVPLQVLVNARKIGRHVPQGKPKSFEDLARIEILVVVNQPIAQTGRPRDLPREIAIQPPVPIIGETTSLVRLV